MGPTQLDYLPGGINVVFFARGDPDNPDWTDPNRKGDPKPELTRKAHPDWPAPEVPKR